MPIDVSFSDDYDDDSVADPDYLPSDVTEYVSESDLDSELSDIIPVDSLLKTYSSQK